MRWASARAATRRASVRPPQWGMSSWQTSQARGANRLRKSVRFVTRSPMAICGFTAQVAVGADEIADGPDPELRARQARNLAEDVPQGEVDAGDSRGPHDAAAVPEVLAEHHLPEVFDAGRILADHQLGQVLDGADD